jgi:hypothetical protein
MMSTTHEAHEISEKITEGGGHHHGPGDEENFRKRVSVFIGFLALLLTINGVAGSAAMKETINANIRASDNYSFYQAKYMRQTSYLLAARQLELLGESLTGAPQSTSEGIASTVAQYREIAERHESDPKGGAGKKELLAQAKNFDLARDDAQKRDINFEFGEGLLQIAIVLASTSMIGMSRRLLMISGGFAAIGLVLALNGFVGLVDLRSLL